MPLVLVVDDSRTDRLYMRRVLEAKGYEVIEAADGAEALERVKEHPTVILLDVVMPIMDGFETLAALQSDPDVAFIPILLMTSRDSGEDAVTGLLEGAHDFLRKPVDATDLESRVGAAARVAALYTQLRTRGEDLEVFAHHVAHDIKSPLSIIRSYVDMLAGKWGEMTDEQKTDAAARIARAVDRTVHLVDDILALAQHGMEAKTSAQCDPETVVKSVLEAAELNDTLVDVAGEWQPVSISASALEAVLRNLIDNASHYGRSDDGTLRLKIRGRCADSRFALTVEDEGSGVDPDEAERLFQPFERGRDAPSVNPRSTGVGLAIVRRATERWGGTVTLSRGGAGGARFRVLLRTPRPS